MNKILKVTLAGVFALFGFVAVSLAQDAVAGPDVSGATIKGIPVASLITLFTVFVVQGVKFLNDRFGSKIPNAILPLIAAVIGYASDFVSHLTFGTQSNGVLALVAGLGAVGLHQVYKQLKPDAPAVNSPSN